MGLCFFLCLDGDGGLATGNQGQPASAGRTRLEARLGQDTASESAGGQFDHRRRRTEVGGGMTGYEKEVNQRENG